jgi:hypothetical protein
MTSSNPTGMGDVTAVRFRQLASDIDFYNSSTQYNIYHPHHYHSTSATVYTEQPATSFIRRCMQNLFPQLYA